MVHNWRKERDYIYVYTDNSKKKKNIMRLAHYVYVCMWCPHGCMKSGLPGECLPWVEKSCCYHYYYILEQTKNKIVYVYSFYRPK